MEAGGTWMRQEETIKNQFGGGTYALFATQRRREAVLYFFYKC